MVYTNQADYKTILTTFVASEISKFNLDIFFSLKNTLKWPLKLEKKSIECNFILPPEMNL